MIELVAKENKTKTNFAYMISLDNSFLESNLYRFYEDFIGFEDFVCKNCGPYDIIYSKKYQYPAFVYNVETTSDQAGRIIQELDLKIVSREIPPLILIDPKRVPMDFEERVYEIGVRKIDYWQIIFLDYDNANLNLLHPPGFKIEEIHDEAQLRHWHEIVNAVLFPGKLLPFEFFRQRLNDERYLFQLGYCNDLPATSFMVFMENKIAGTFMGATLNEFRKKGFGSEIMIRALLDAKKAGCLYATGQSSRMGFPVWEQVGFTGTNTLDIYWKIGNEYK